MEDKRKPFTPMIEPDTPTPEPSPSPRGRGSKTKGDTSISPPRKNTVGKDTQISNTSKKDSKEKEKPTTIKKSNTVNGSNLTEKNKENTEENNKSSKTGKVKPKDRELKENEDSSSSYKKDAFSNIENYDSSKVNEESSESQLQMRAESSLSYHAPSVMTESGYVPFSVEPFFGKVDTGKTQIFKIKFSPLNVNDYQARLICQIPNLEDNKQRPTIAVKGRSLLPYCHFELEESDYITAGRRNQELSGSQLNLTALSFDNVVKVIEFKVVGLSARVMKSFNIINPTNSDYDFLWIQDDQTDSQKQLQFQCLKHKGVVKSGKRHEIAFEFNPKEIGISESVWKFRIPKFDLTIPFLLVGNVTEPRIVFDKSYILFKPLLLGMTGTEIVHLVNQENKQLDFAFDSASCYTEGRFAVILVEPASGSLEPLSKRPITLTLTPHDQRPLVFNLKCNLSNASKPLHLNVKGEGFSLATSLYCEDSNGTKIEFNENNINEIHFGEVEKNEVSYRNLFILNTGRFTVDFECFLTSDFEDAGSCFSIEPQKSFLEPGQKKQCILKYQAKKEKPTFANLLIKVIHGSVYHVHVDGIAVKPDIQFSFFEYNFGPCFIYKAGMPIANKKLNILNAGTKETNVDCLFDNSNTKSCFSIDFKQTILMPKESTTATISFVPRESISYSEKLVFELNGLTKREIVLKGIGSDMKVELKDSRQKIIDVGVLETGKSSKKIVKVVNKSTASIEFNLLFEPKAENLQSDRSILQISPFQKIKMKPNEIIDFEINFVPATRIPKFLEEIFLEYSGISTPLFAVTGACLGYNIWIDPITLPFGAVVEKCYTARRIVMYNEGDIGASFKWESDKLKPDFSINPIEGYISPGMEINFDITFHPNKISPDIRKEYIKCILDGCDPIYLTLSGSCVPVLAQKEVQHFEAFVRQKEIKQIIIFNKTNSRWDLRPIIEGDYFSGLESFSIESQSSKSYDIQYAPLTMTIDGKRHTGSCFFPLPDGTGLLYNLIGVAGPPKPFGKIQRDVPCKIAVVELLNVENWLKKPQRFKVIFELIKPEKPDLSTTVKGLDYVDIPGNGKKDYKVNFYAHKEGITQVKIIFKNESTQEYMFYELVIRALKGGSISSIDLVTSVRTPISYSLKLENPLPTAVNFIANCSNTNEILIPANLQITPKGQVRKGK